MSIYVYGYKHLAYSFPGDAPDVHLQDQFFWAYRCYSDNLGYTHRFVGKETQITGMTKLCAFVH